MASTTTFTWPVSTASAKHIRFSAYKVREVLDLIRGQQAEVALGILENTSRGSAKTVQKILSSAIANATYAQGYEAMELFVLECFADESMTIKRFRPRARGRASRIRKRTCHLTISLGRLSDEELTKLRERKNADLAAKRQRRVRAAQEKSAGSADIASLNKDDEIDNDGGLQIEQTDLIAETDLISQAESENVEIEIDDESVESDEEVTSSQQGEGSSEVSDELKGTKDGEISEDESDEAGEEN